MTRRCLACGHEMDVSLGQGQCAECGSELPPEGFTSFSPAPPRASPGAPARLAGGGLYLLGVIASLGIFAAIVATVHNDLVRLLCAAALYPVFALLNRLKRHGKKMIHSGGVEHPVAGARFILYLRSFRSDGDVSGAETPVFRATLSFEERLVLALETLAPTYAVGRPGEPLPELGARRLYFAAYRWTAEVEALLRDAWLTVLRVGRTEALGWEVGQVVQRVPPARVLLVLSSGDLLENYPAFALGPGSAFPHPLPPLDSRRTDELTVLRFDAEWMPAATGYSFVEFRAALRSGVLTNPPESLH